MKDYYEKVAEFYPIGVQSFAESEKMLRKELSSMPSPSHPILDIGSGAGRTVIAIAESIPDVEIFAVEPSSVMRAVLTQQVVQRDDLKKRVTIIPETIDKVTLPAKLGAVVAYGVLGHLNLIARKKLWAELLPRLPKGAPIFVELMPIDKPTEITSMPMAQEKIGQRSYEQTLSTKHEEDDLMRLNIKWTISGGITPEVVIENTIFWYTFGIDDLACETGLTAKKLTKEAGVLYA